MLTRYIVSVILLCLVHSFVSAQVTEIQTTTEKDLIPEGIAIDSKGNIYISSINQHKIIRIKNGKVSDFVKAHQDGFMEGLGMKVDEKRGWLWGVSILKDGRFFHSKIHAFDLKTGKTMQQYTLKEDSVSHLLNDLIIADDGSLFITDTYASSVYRLSPETKSLKLFVKSPQLNYPNGLTFGNNRIYIATYMHGIVQLDTASKELSKVNGIADTLISHGLDGLVYYNNSLFGVYNTGATQERNCVVNYSLSKDGNNVESEKILNAGYKHYADPTTVALYKNALYVITNSHLDSFNKNKTSTKGIESVLKPLRLLKIPVK